MKGDPVLKTKTRTELAAEYGIAVNTLKSRLRKAGITIPAGLIYPKTLKIIYQKLGRPQNPYPFTKDSSTAS